MKRVMVRPARDDFDAMRIAQAMLQAGAEVISIAYDGKHLQHGAIQECSRYNVFAKVSSDAHIDTVDEYINRALE